MVESPSESMAQDEGWLKPWRELAAQIEANSKAWRGRFYDLPVVVLILSLIRKMAAALEPDSLLTRPWSDLKKEGERLSRSRALFVAAEAVGQLSETAALAEQRADIRENLGVLIREGTSLHKVRGLRALRFIASEECIPHIEQGLRDPSPWVQATALRALFRLNLRERQPHALLLHFIVRLFWQSCRDPLDGLYEVATGREADEMPPNIFVLSRGLVAGLFRQRGARRLGALSLLLWGLAAVWYAVFSVAATLFFVAAIPFGALAIGMALLLALVLILTSARADHARVRPCAESIEVHSGRSTWPQIVVQAVPNYAFLGLVAVLLPFPQSLIVIIIALIVLISPSGEEIPGVFRALGLVFLSMQLPLADWRYLTIVVLALVQLLWVGMSILRSGKWKPVLADIGLTAFLTAFIVVFCGLLFAVFAGLFVSGIGMIVIVFVSVFLLLRPLVLWETWVVESIRVPLLWRWTRVFRDLDAYLDHMVKVVRSPWLPLWVRTHAVFRLMDVPLAGSQVIARLIDLADEDLPPRLKDAIYQVVDTAEARVQRGQVETTGFEASRLAGSEPEPSPGEILQPRLILLLLAATGVAFLIGSELLVRIPSLSFSEWAALAELVCGTLLVFAGMIAGRKHPRQCLWTLTLGLGLLGLAMAWPMQVEVGSPWSLFPSLEVSWPSGLEIVLLGEATVVSVVIPMWFALVLSILGYYVYVLLCDVSLKPVSGDTTGTRSTESSQNWSTSQDRNDGALDQPEGTGTDQTLTAGSSWRRCLAACVALALLGSLLQSVALEDYLRLDTEPLPAVTAGPAGRTFALDDVPQDGRIIRVALVVVPAPNERPPLLHSFPKASKSVPGPPSTQRFERKLLHEVLPDDVCWGEIWIAAEPGTPRVWVNLPNGHLAVALVSPGRVTFQVLGDAGSRPSSGLLRPLVLVYNSRRSPWVRKLADPDRFRDAFETIQPNTRILANTLNFLVRPVWGPLIPVPP
jgi:hypothetical protein